MVYTVLWAGPAGKVVCIQGVGQAQSLPQEYTDFAEVFSTENAGCLLSHKVSNHVIDLNGKKPPYGPLYNLSTMELKVL